MKKGIGASPGLVSATNTMRQYKFGAAKHFVPRNLEGETKSSSKYRNIESEYVGNLTKIKAFRTRVANYGMQAPFLIQELVDPTGAEPWDCFGPENTCLDLMNHWSTFLFEHIHLFQKDTNKAAGDDEDLTSTMWVKELIVNSSDPALIQRIGEKFE